MVQLRRRENSRAGFKQSASRLVSGARAKLVEIKRPTPRRSGPGPSHKIAGVKGWSN